MPAEEDERNNVRVYCRVRPLSERETAGGQQRQCLGADCARGLVALQCKPEPRVFAFDAVASEATSQAEVFDMAGRAITVACLQGYNGTIFAYGQTGSGKTFTILGPNADAASAADGSMRGMLPRALECLFDTAAQMQRASPEGSETSFAFRCSFLEIYNERVFDLLDPASEGLHLRESAQRGAYAEGAIEVPVASAADAHRIVTKGAQNRHVAATAMNRESSRSHSVFTLAIEGKICNDGITRARSARFHLIDLAGSERQRDTAAAGERLKEARTHTRSPRWCSAALTRATQAGSINKSLSALAHVINALVEVAGGRRRHVHYRDSKLTFLLKDSLGGNSITHIVATVSPAADNFGETLSTLKFAQRAKMIKNQAVVNEDTLGSQQKLQAEIQRLRALLSGKQTAAPAAGPAAAEAEGVPAPLDATAAPSLLDSAAHGRVLRAEERLRAALGREAEVARKFEGAAELCGGLKRQAMALRLALRLRECALARLLPAAQRQPALLTDDDAASDASFCAHEPAPEAAAAVGVMSPVALRREVLSLRSLLAAPPQAVEWRLRHDMVAARLRAHEDFDPSDFDMLEDVDFEEEEEEEEEEGREEDGSDSGRGERRRAAARRGRRRELATLRAVRAAYAEVSAALREVLAEKAALVAALQRAARAPMVDLGPPLTPRGGGCSVPEAAESPLVPLPRRALAVPAEAPSVTAEEVAGEPLARWRTEQQLRSDLESLRVQLAAQAQVLGEERRGRAAAERETANARRLAEELRASVEAQRAAREAESARLRRQIALLERRVEEETAATEQSLDLESQLATAKREHSVLASAVTDLRQSEAALSHANRDLLARVDAEVARCAEVSAELDRALAEAQSAGAQREAAVEEASAAGARASAAEAARSAAESARSAAEAKWREASSRAEAAEAEARAARQKAAEAEAQAESAGCARAEVEQRAAAAEWSLLNLQEDHDTLREQFAFAADSEQQARAELAEAHAALAAASAQAEALSRSLQEATARATVLGATGDQTMQELAAAVRAREELEHQRAALAQQLEEALAQAARTAVAAAASGREAEAARRDAAAERDVIVELSANVARLRAQLAELTERAEAAEARADGAESRVASTAEAAAVDAAAAEAAAELSAQHLRAVTQERDAALAAAAQAREQQRAATARGASHERAAQELREQVQCAQAECAMQTQWSEEVERQLTTARERGSEWEKRCREAQAQIAQLKDQIQAVTALISDSCALADDAPAESVTGVAAAANGDQDDETFNGSIPDQPEPEGAGASADLATLLQGRRLSVIFNDDRRRTFGGVREVTTKVLETSRALAATRTELRAAQEEIAALQQELAKCRAELADTSSDLAAAVAAQRAAEQLADVLQQAKQELAREAREAALRAEAAEAEAARQAERLRALADVEVQLQRAHEAEAAAKVRTEQAVSDALRSTEQLQELETQCQQALASVQSKATQILTLETQRAQLRAKLKSAEQTVAKLSAEAGVLREQNAALIGHQNHRQKIQLHVEIKKENNRLRQRERQLLEIISKLERGVSAPLPPAALAAGSEELSSSAEDEEGVWQTRAEAAERTSWQLRDELAAVTDALQEALGADAEGASSATEHSDAAPVSPTGAPAKAVRRKPLAPLVGPNAVSAAEGAGVKPGARDTGKEPMRTQHKEAAEAAEAAAAAGMARKAALLLLGERQELERVRMELAVVRQQVERMQRQRRLQLRRSSGGAAQ